ncbi:Tetratricopeptide repeat-containing protein [Arboricoccus pini]|uniref:Tetratricopeptide repeat-containing protein n=1 Tax=Arboricoccus pini TaxID=1963835 RepID=A0A212R9W2_9PROT|nr:Tetratricopeptide repeat-containing protein [Arboricoccus pini]
MGPKVLSGAGPSRSPTKPASGGLRRRLLPAVAVAFMARGGARAKEAVSTQSLLDALANCGDATTAEGLILRLRSLWRDALGAAARQRLEDAELALSGRDTALGSRLLERLLSQWPDYIAAWQAMAALQWSTGDLTGSIMALRRVLALEPRQFDALYLLGVDLLGLGRLEEAERAFQAVLRVNPFDTLARAQMLRLIGKDGAARQDL